MLKIHLNRYKHINQYKDLLGCEYLTNTNKNKDIIKLERVNNE